MVQVSVLPRDTLACRLEEPEIEPPTFQLANDEAEQVRSLPLFFPIKAPQSKHTLACFKGQQVVNFAYKMFVLATYLMLA